MTEFISQINAQDYRADRTFPHPSGQPEIATGALRYSSRAEDHAQSKPGMVLHSHPAAL
jgi:hypothetical protein